MYSRDLIKIRFFTFLLFFISIPSSEQLVPPSESKINYYGRIDFSDEENPEFCWSGVIIEANFTGSVIGMKIDHQNAYYDVVIDDFIDTIIKITSDDKYIFASNLSESIHTVRIKLRSEDHLSTGSFKGLIIDDNQELKEPPPKPLRKIEFIGDSYTAGYGIESPDRVCDPEQLNRYTNVNVTFAAKVTESFHAQSIILGWSGSGLVKNYNTQTTQKRSPDPFPYYYGRLLGASDNKEWNFSSWIPQLVVICLGTNDYTHNRNPQTNPPPDDSMFIGDYHRFIDRIKTNYPDASVICMSTGNETFEKNVKEVVSQQHTIYNNPNVYFAPYPTSLTNTGCDWHPSVEDNEKVARILIDTIMVKMGWDTTGATKTKHLSLKNNLNGSNFSVTHFLNAIELKNQFTFRETLVYSLLSLDGKIIMRKKADKNGICFFPITSAYKGVFVVGNHQLGWEKVLIK